MKQYMNIFRALLLGGMLSLSGCDDFLDTMPDNRTEIDTEEKVEFLLVSAGPEAGYQFLTEYLSDNVDDAGDSNPNTDLFLDQVYTWTDVTESNNESPESVWQASYSAIAAANQALVSIDEIISRTGETKALVEARAEALMCRAYNHFVLVNVFALHYNSKTANSTPGITYMEAPETTLQPNYVRNTVADVYAKIDADLQAALPNVGTSYMTVPKYHFNEVASYAFAARFYLYYEKYDEAIKWADKVLGSVPQSMMKSYEAVGRESSREAQGNVYISATDKGNLLLATGYSSMGLAFGPYYSYKRYTHSSYLASSEDCVAAHPWAAGSTVKQSDYYATPRSYSATNLNAYIFWRLPYLFEYSDPVAGVGFRRSVFPLLTTQEVILNRAEAYIMKKQYDKACDDINIWAASQYKNYTVVTPEYVKEFYSSRAYAYDSEAGVAKASNMGSTKKHLNPAFAIEEEGSVQESMLQCVINARRVEMLQCGNRWFDIKRFGIEIPRRRLASNGMPEECYDWLLKDDPRRAVQIPKKVMDAGYEPNKRLGNQTSSNVVEVVEETTVDNTATIND
ncbi:MAG: RagB/SusD family nutrient uptake outer membrane protein [Bacteroidales bacterium]|nr:RagB/SusD family nutrient uptake outer membrane protein [Bacteroidales bacterium]